MISFVEVLRTVDESLISELTVARLRELSTMQSRERAAQQKLALENAKSKLHNMFSSLASSKKSDV